jgi:3-polyprenyl-4-hydroxybenzoate decarboxylase
VLWKDATGIMLDPSMPRDEAVCGSKMGIDATKSVDYPERSLPPQEQLDEVKEHWSR